MIPLATLTELQGGRRGSRVDPDLQSSRLDGFPPVLRSSQRAHRQNMMLTSEQKRGALLGPCFPLRFLVRIESRSNTRENMKGFSDSAIFHRWMDLFWTLREPDAKALLTPEEIGYLTEFAAAFEALPWRPIESHPHISALADNDLSTLFLPSATRLLESLEKRTRPPIIKRWWRQVMSMLRLRAEALLIIF